MVADLHAGAVRLAGARQQGRLAARRPPSPGVPACRTSAARPGAV